MYKLLKLRVVHPQTSVNAASSTALCKTNIN